MRLAKRRKNLKPLRRTRITRRSATSALPLPAGSSRNKYYQIDRTKRWGATAARANASRCTAHASPRATCANP